ncbi:MAG TPA: 4'-phosphopantetheinyl transferase superfamily protein [bacterium]|nr:4'-phosphopantetheinyl transferase superfamily protein [bacterium]
MKPLVSRDESVDASLRDRLDSEVHVWREQLDRPDAERIKLYSLLSPDERERASRFRLSRDRDAYVVARGRLREILSFYLNRDPAGIRFRYSPTGKPALASGQETGGIQFNVAHSYRQAVIAVTWNRRVGVDLEYMDVRAVLTIADEFFSPGEKSAYAKLLPEERMTAFFLWWTRKEAFVKALGEGLSVPLDQFEVSFHPGEPAALRWTGWDSQAPDRWRLEDLALDPGYTGTLAVEGWEWTLVYAGEPTAHETDLWEGNAGHQKKDHPESAY